MAGFSSPGGVPDPWGSILVAYQPKPSHMDLVRTTVHGFHMKNCIRQVRAWATISPVLQSTSLSTPQTVLELANMLRDPIGNLRCPFGSDFEEQDMSVDEV